MSRSGYTDDLDDNWQLIRWRGMVASAIRGKRGQKCLVDLLAALDAMPEKALISHELETTEGDVCALGALGKARNIDMQNLDPEEPEFVAAAFDIATPLAQEIVYMNDEHFDYRFNEFSRKSEAMTPEQRWAGMRAWVASKIQRPAPETAPASAEPNSAGQPNREDGGRERE